jgi:hypothetical protein
MTKPFYEGQEVRVYCPDIFHPEIIYGRLAPPDHPWPFVVLIVNADYPRGTYCGITWIEEVEGG